MAAHEGAFMSLFMRQSGGQRVLPSQDSEDTQQQFSRARPRSIKAFLPPFYRLSTRDVTHVRKCTRPSPAFPYCKRRKAGRGPGNEASEIYLSNAKKKNKLECFIKYSPFTCREWDKLETDVLRSYTVKINGS